MNILCDQCGKLSRRCGENRGEEDIGDKRARRVRNHCIRTDALRANVRCDDVCTMHFVDKDKTGCRAYKKRTSPTRGTEADYVSFLVVHSYMYLD